jgi:hypothetical protein
MERFEKPVSRASRASRPWFAFENSHGRDAHDTFSKLSMTNDPMTNDESMANDPMTKQMPGKSESV